MIDGAEIGRRAHVGKGRQRKIQVAVRRCDVDLIVAVGQVDTLGVAHHHCFGVLDVAALASVAVCIGRVGGHEFFVEIKVDRVGFGVRHHGHTVGRGDGKNAVAVVSDGKVSLKETGKKITGVDIRLKGHVLIEKTVERNGFFGFVEIGGDLLFLILSFGIGGACGRQSACRHEGGQQKRRSLACRTVFFHMSFLLWIYSD